MRTPLSIVLIGLLCACAALLGGCDDQVAECEEGRSLVCTCADGAPGAQRCSGGALGECVCDADTADGQSDAEPSDVAQSPICIEVVPSNGIDYGLSIIGQSKTMNVTVLNCGNQELTVTAIALAPESAPYVLPTTSSGAPEMPLNLADSTPPHTEGDFWHVGSIEWTAAGGSFVETDPSTQPQLGFPP